MPTSAYGATKTVAPLPVFLSLIPSAVAIFVPWIVLRPNRVAAGVSYNIFSIYSAGVLLPIALLALIATALVFSIITEHKRNGPPEPNRVVIGALTVWTGSVTVVPWYLFLLGTTRLLDMGELGELARVNPTIGFWLMLLSCLIGWHELVRLSRRISRRIVYPTMVIALAVVFIIITRPNFQYLSYYVEYSVRSRRFLDAMLRHMALSGSALSLACIIGVPAGIAAYRFPRFRDTIMDVTSTIQTIPSLAMFGLLIAPLAALSRALPVLRRAGISGVGVTPALIALTLYALLPIVRNTVTGLLFVSPEVRESGRAMGMNRRQLFRMVEIPVALPVLLGGIRTAAVQAVGNTTVAGLIGAGGLGWFIFQGLGQAATDLVVLGVIPIVILAIGVDRFFGIVQKIADRGKIITEVAE